MLASLAPSAWAQATVEKFSADTPMRADALAKSDFDGIVAEAQSVADSPRSAVVIRLPAHWKALDKGKLVAIMRMPGFVDIPDSARGVLLDQAATWDLLAFHRPSDAAVLWERLWPRAAHADPKNAPNASDGIGYLPDPTWSTTARAMSTIFACFPRIAWAVDDPAVFVTRNPEAWQWRNDSGWEGFRRCAPEGAFFDDTKPDKAGVRALVKMLRTKLGAELAEDGCTRPGPDSCLLLFQAVFSLDQRDPQLARLLKVMEPSFHLDQPIALPAQPEALYDTETEALRRTLFLTLKLPVLLRYPGAWPVGERERTLAQATALTVLLARMEPRIATRHQHFDRYYDSPWQWVDATKDAPLADLQRKLGVDYAQREACALANVETGQGIASFWQGYALENIRLGHGDCGRSNDLAVMCAAKPPVTAPGARQLCADIKAREAQRVALEQQQLAAEKALQPPVDPLACADYTIASAADALHFGAGADYWSEWNAACRLDPSDQGHAIVALAYHPGDEQTGESSDDIDSDSDLDLDIVVMNLADAAVLAHRHEAAAITSDAIRFEGMNIDTGRYVLAPGKRAFGIRTLHSAHCYQCAYGDSDLALYVRDGKRIEPLLQIRVAETRNEELPDCPDAISESSTVIDVGADRSHGLADLLLTTTYTTTDNGEEAHAACASTQAGTVRARFDGHAYRLPDPPAQNSETTHARTRE